MSRLVGSINKWRAREGVPVDRTQWAELQAM
jgi:hypothetical protein